jgi:hypothetical protein
MPSVTPVTGVIGLTVTDAATVDVPVSVRDRFCDGLLHDAAPAVVAVNVTDTRRVRTGTRTVTGTRAFDVDRRTVVTVPVEAARTRPAALNVPSVAADPCDAASVLRSGLWLVCDATAVDVPVSVLRSWRTSSADRGTAADLTRPACRVVEAVGVLVAVSLRVPARVTVAAVVTVAALVADTPTSRVAAIVCVAVSVWSLTRCDVTVATVALETERTAPTCNVRVAVDGWLAAFVAAVARPTVAAAGCAAARSTVNVCGPPAVASRVAAYVGWIGCDRPSRAMCYSPYKMLARHVAAAGDVTRIANPFDGATCGSNPSGTQNSYRPLKTGTYCESMMRLYVGSTVAL